MMVMVGNKIRSLWARLTLLVVEDDGMSTVEYAIGTIVAAASGAILYTVVTIEAAFAIAALVVVLVLCVSGLTAVSMQVRCIDAAREAARLAARGDDGSTGDAAQRIAPDGAAVQLRRDGEFVVARVTAKSPLLPGITVAAEAVAAAEPGPR